MQSEPESTAELKRDLSLTQATVLNMIDMVGIGPFLALPIILLAFPGKFSLIPWLIGAVISFADGLVWAELGAAYPKAGGSYIFLQKIYDGKFGKMMAFLYAFQTTLHTPLVITSAAIGFANYAGYFFPMNFLQTKLLMIGLVIVIIVLLYRRINAVGKIGIFFSVLVVLMLLATIITGYLSFNHQVFLQNSSFFKGVSKWNNAAFWLLMGNYSAKTLYAFLGYYNVCHLGSEIKNPQRNIPKSIIISIVVISVFYLSMQWMIAGAIPQSQITGEHFPLISFLFEKQFGHTVATIATLLLLMVAASSLFAVLLGYTRTIYAAACEGMHFKIFSHLHAKKNFPDYALLILGGIAIVFCCFLSEISMVLQFIVVTRIFIQFIPQAVGVILLRFKKRTGELPYKMPLYPLTAILSIIGWTFVFVTSGTKYFMSGIAVIVIGVIVYWTVIDRKRKILE